MPASIDSDPENLRLILEGLRTLADRRKGESCIQDGNQYISPRDEALRSIAKTKGGQAS